MGRDLRRGMSQVPDMFFIYLLIFFITVLTKTKSLCRHMEVRRLEKGPEWIGAQDAMCLKSLGIFIKFFTVITKLILCLGK